ncbi:MAG: SAM-dependent methyltransferase [Polaribacter sp.]
MKWVFHAIVFYALTVKSIYFKREWNNETIKNKRMSNKIEDQSKNDLEQYWSKRYVDESTGWDLGLVSVPIRAYADQLQDKNIKILIPGAGNAYEAEYLYRSGFINTNIVDISTIPLQNFKERVPSFPADQIILGDFFELQGQFDLIIEQTFYCSFPPIDNNRAQYVQQMHKLLKPNGKLVGLWFNIPLTGDLEKRPFGGTVPEYVKQFESHFEMQVFEEANNSVESRAGKELFGILRRRGLVE